MAEDMSASKVSFSINIYAHDGTRDQWYTRSKCEPGLTQILAHDQILHDVNIDHRSLATIANSCRSEICHLDLVHMLSF